MNWLIDQIFTLIGLGLFLFLIAAVLAPLESLGWWAGWGGKPKRLAPAGSQVLSCLPFGNWCCLCGWPGARRN